MKTIGSKIRKSPFRFYGKLGIVLISILTVFPQIAIGQMVSSEINQELNVRQEQGKGLMLCTREVRLKPNVDPIAFEKWIAEYWNPEWLELIPGFQCYVDKVKSDQGENTYIHFLGFNIRSKSEPGLANTADYTDWYREFIYYKPTKYLYDELFEFIEIESFFNNKDCQEIIRGAEGGLISH